MPLANLSLTSIVSSDRICNTLTNIPATKRLYSAPAATYTSSGSKGSRFATLRILEVLVVQKIPVEALLGRDIGEVFA